MNKKYLKDNKSVMNKYAQNVTNPTVSPDGETKKKSPIPSKDSVEQSKEWGEEHEV